ncbi:hypothetical protein F5Y11DRAFT_367651 [Daldinia sp. FL1419]|nr:hypothetical protein F5Y11DRAFT_367651 [Daldinia sp. FL1419]
MARKRKTRQSSCLKCLKCSATFADHRTLYLHQQDKGHLVCGLCKFPFHEVEVLIQHQAEAHKLEKHLLCPGCDKRFASVGKWMYHVEKGECCAIFPSDLAGNVSEAVNSIAEALRKTGLDEEGVEDYHIDTTAYAPITDVWGDGWADGADREMSLDARDNPEAFPRTAKQQFYQGDSKQIDLLATDGGASPKQDPANIWAQNLFPEKKGIPAERPPPSLLESMSKPAPSVQPTGKRIVDPDHPDFNVALFMVPILETFKCPHKTCGSKHDTSEAFIAHLKSPKHTQIPFWCPGCAEEFSSGASWVQHAETIRLTKCSIRNSGIYKNAVKMMTNGVLDIDAFNELANGSAKAKLNKGWAASKQGKRGAVPGTDEWVKEKEREASMPLPGPKKRIHEDFQW